MIVLDTHVVLWLTTDKRLLSSAAAEAIRNASRAAEGVAIADSSLWEIAMASTKGRIRLPGTLADYLRYVEKTFVVLPITGAIAERSILLSDSFSKEPADRLIAATAIVHGLTLVTKDEKIRKSGEVPYIW